MAYDEKLLQRVRASISGHDGIAEKRMFGGMAFMHRGSMAFGVETDRLMIRVGPDRHDAGLRRLLCSALWALRAAAPVAPFARGATSSPPLGPVAGSGCKDAPS